MRLPEWRPLMALHWALGGVLLVQAALLAFHPAAPRQFAASGYPDWVRLALAGSEIVAAARTLLSGAISACEEEFKLAEILFSSSFGEDEK